MGRKKRFIALVMTAVLVLTIAACGGKDTESKSTSVPKDTAGQETVQGSQSSAAAEVDFNDAAAIAARYDLSEKYDISIWRYKEDFIYYDNLGEQPVAKYLDDMFNISLNFEHPATGNEVSDLNMMIATGDYTDVVEMSYSQDGSISLYEDGVIYDLAPYIAKYMPNLTAWMAAHEDFAKGMTDEEGHIFTLPVNTGVEPGKMWGGLVYRRDILESMTGGNVVFPSGNDAPTTVADWDYMLELMKQYFDASGLADWACLIIPAQGYFDTGELLNGFGTTGTYMVKDDVVYFGPYTDNFYNYLSKMREWYQKGYLYQDFASRVNDIFYLPNTALTFGGSAGVWYSTTGYTGDRMSMPEYGLNVNVQPLAAPADTENGIDTPYGLYCYNEGTSINQGWAVTTACSEEKLIRFLAAMDWLYSDYGSMVRSWGLTAKEGAAENIYYQQLGLTDGLWSYDENGNFVPNDLVNGELLDSGAVEDKDISEWNLAGNQLPGLYRNDVDRPQSEESRLNDEASLVWMTYGHDNCYPMGAYLTSEETVEHTKRYTTIKDYVSSMTVKFITGTAKLNETTWQEYKDQLKSYGVEDNIAVYQTAYDRYIN